MKDFFKERERLEEEAIDFLKSSLYAGHPEDCPRYVHFAISVYDKNHWPKEYQKGVQCFKALFQAGEESYRPALWNMVVNYYLPATKVCKGDFSKEEYAFIRSALNAVGDMARANVNRPLKTERLLLRAIERKDQSIFADNFIADGEFTLFTGMPSTKSNIKEFSLQLMRSIVFAIERRADRKLLGYIGLSLRETSATGLLEYYLFKDERRKGYCKEAVEALTEITLQGKLYLPVETVQLGVYRKKAIRLNAIRARISSLNIASQRTVESCGFVHEATVHQTMYKGTAGWTDEEIYYMTREMISHTTPIR